MPQARVLGASLIALAMLGGGVAASVSTGDWTFFARAGAVLVMLGAILTAWRSLAAGHSPLRNLISFLSAERLPSETLGLCLMLLGTVIWAFGDLAGLVFS